MDLKSISHLSTWGSVASALNDNFNLVRDYIEFENTNQSLAKGIFETLEDLEIAYPNPNEGDWAYVGTSFPAYIYTWNGTSWVKSEDQEQPDKIELEGYIKSEQISDPTAILY
jgi:hypothetical protein